MSVSISEGHDSTLAAVADIITGGAGFEARLARFREIAAQADHAQRTARQMMAEAEALLGNAKQVSSDAAALMARATASHQAAQVNQAALQDWHNEYEALTARYSADLLPDLLS